ncbi:hypothetical protein [Maridesulfovibrio sp.]|uniref:hypothetical protein n=1 Tax=Maridesulfovibrio sp. TaxID=2795000 RepID=UPI0029F52AA2|nr:hypothetical protein [Maridesulfovibrio sp.]
MKINESSGFKFNIFNMKEKEAEEENSTHQQAVAQEPQGHSYSQRNMMADSFVKTNREESRYINGLMTSYAVADQFRSRMQNVVDIYKAEADLVSSISGDSYAAMMLVGQKAERAAKEEAENYTGEKMEEKLEKDRKEREEEQDKKVEEKIEEKLMPEGAKQVLDAEPDPEQLTEEIAEKAEEATETRGDKVLKGDELGEGQTVAGGVQAAEQVSTVSAASSVTSGSEKKVELTSDSAQTVQGGSSAAGAVPPPGTYVDEIV